VRRRLREARPRQAAADPGVDREAADPASYPLGNAFAGPVAPLFPVIITLEDAYGAPVTGVSQVRVTTLHNVWRVGSTWTEFDAKLVSWKEKSNGLYEFQIPIHPPYTQWMVEAAGCRMRHGIISVP
jgi:hypothetical protein